MGMSIGMGTYRRCMRALRVRGDDLLMFPARATTRAPFPYPSRLVFRYPYSESFIPHPYFLLFLLLFLFFVRFLSFDSLHLSHPIPRHPRRIFSASKSCNLETQKHYISYWEGYLLKPISSALNTPVLTAYHHHPPASAPQFSVKHHGVRGLC